MVEEKKNKNPISYFSLLSKLRVKLSSFIYGACSTTTNWTFLIFDAFHLDGIEDPKCRFYYRIVRVEFSLIVGTPGLRLFS